MLRRKINYRLTSIGLFLSKKKYKNYPNMEFYTFNSLIFTETYLPKLQN